MSKNYIIPYYNKTNTTHKTTITNAIRFLSNKYMLDRDYLEDTDSIALLETICNLSNLYLDMKEV